ncbi:MAG: hypothetical protein IT350_02110 [Deltaproteobacteria bacterium]|nr:hypothetical protein [Deltaproteobacteria bacterium]
MNEPVNIAAIDAGTNGIRIAIVEAKNPTDHYVLERDRVAVRLGHHVFTRRNFDPSTIAEAEKAFAHFRALFDRYNVQKYRAVATSAARNARNRNALVDAAWNAGKIDLEVVSGTEEARLVRTGVLAQLPEDVSPRLILDLGGGSLEFNLLRDRNLEYAATVPIGVVRLLETFDATDAISAAKEEALRLFIIEKLAAHFRETPDVSGGDIIACGGNAEALAAITGGVAGRYGRALDMAKLRRLLRPLLRMRVEERMALYDIRRDRADVIDIAALIFLTIGQWLGASRFWVTGGGVRDGLIDDLVRSHFHAKRRPSDRGRAKLLVASCRDFGLRHGFDDRHADHVRGLAKRLFDQLAPLHGLPRDSRVLLEMGAMLHDVGQCVNYRDHPLHGEYLIRHGDIAGLGGVPEDMVACLVRFHGKQDPALDDETFTRLDEKHRNELCALLAILRIADGLDCEHRQAVVSVEVKISAGKVDFTAKRQGPSKLAIWGARRKDKLFERVFGRKATFKFAS